MTFWNTQKKILARTAFVALFAFLLPVTLAAQNLPGNDRSGIELDLEPNYPDPGEEVTVTAEGLPASGVAANVRWFSGGQLINSGRGVDSVTVTVPEFGDSLTVSATITSQNTSIERSVTITPGSVDLLWEADTYIPPFYKGRALPAEQSDISITAIPHVQTRSGQRVETDQMRYAWSKDYTQKPELSGYNRRRNTIDGKLIQRDATYRVIASSVSSQSEAGASGQFTLEYRQPEIVFYERFASGEIEHARAISNGSNIGGGTIEVVAEPYFFSFDNRRVNSGNYTWEVNNEEVTITGAKDILLLELPEEGSGQAQLELDIENSDEILQQADREVRLEF